MRHHDASKLLQRGSAAEQPWPAPLPVEDSIPDSPDRIGSQVTLRSGADPSVLLSGTVLSHLSLEYTATIDSFSNGAREFDGMAVGDTIAFDETYALRFGG